MTLKLSACFLALFSMAWAGTPRPVADVSIPTPGQKPISVRQFRGKVVILVLISTTCGDCIQTVGLMSKIEKDLGSRGLQVIGATVDNSNADAVTAFVERYRPTFPIGYLDNPAAIKLAEIEKGTRPFAPILLFIDRQGTVRIQYYGNDPVFKQADTSFRKIAEGLLNEGARPAAQKAPAAPSQH